MIPETRPKIFAVTLLGLTLIGPSAVGAQTPGTERSPTGTDLSSAAARKGPDWEKRERALSFLLEGQRHYRSMMRTRSRAGLASSAAAARAALTAALELDPNLAEAYTALAEVVLMVSPGGLDQGLGFASKAIAVDPDNFGGNRLRARLLTLKSGLGSDSTDLDAEQSAVEAWSKVAALDPRNAEAWAFLGEFHKTALRPAERIEALKKWLASSVPSEPGFYSSVMGNESDLSPEAAAVPLGEALLDEGRAREALEVLNNAVADDPDDAVAFDLLKTALEMLDGKAAQSAAPTLEQVIFADPDNSLAVRLLASLRARGGRLEDGLKLLSDAAARFKESAPDSFSAVLITRGEILTSVGRHDEALASFDDVLRFRGIAEKRRLSEYERELQAEVVGHKLRTLRLADRYPDAFRLLGEVRAKAGAGDLFADREEIQLLRETSQREKALKTVRALRSKNAKDPGLPRLEASILAELGSVDQAVAVMRPFLGRSGGEIDDFSTHIFISSLYATSNRPAEALASAELAAASTDSFERRQIADLAKAYAYQKAGEAEAAERILRDLLVAMPGNPLALNNLGYLLADRGERLDEAANLIFKALRVDSGNPSYLDSIGWVYARKGEYEFAYDYLKRASIMNPSSPTVLAHLGEVCLRLGRPAEAEAYLLRAKRLSADPKLTAEIESKLKTVRKR